MRTPRPQESGGREREEHLQMAVKKEEVVIIVGAGQSGLAVAACLAAHNVPSLILERDDCVGSLWRHRCYDRVCLHLAKRYCQLPLAPHPPDAPTYLPKGHFARYLEDYAARFRLRISFRREVTSAEYDEASSRWRVLATSREAEEAADAVEEEYAARYLVVASGENDEAVVPEIPGVEGFVGPLAHSSQYRSGSVYQGLDVLVVGSGNSGVEIAYDLLNCGARPSIVVKSKLHIVSREIWFVGMILGRILPLNLVDYLILLLCYLKFGDTSKYGFHRPKQGPMYLKIHTPAYPVYICTLEMFKSGKVQVLPSLKSMNGNHVTFSDGRTQHFDAIILATGYRSALKKWLKGDEYLLGDDGMAKHEFPNHWKGRNGLYCAGLVRRGIFGSREDAESIAKDISSSYEP